MSELRLVQVADLHLGASQEHHLDNWRKILAWVGRERPDLVVVNGDLVMADPDEEIDHAFARTQIDRLGVPVRILPGNHDVGDNVVFGKMPQRVNAERMARYRRHYGEDRFSFSAAGWGFIDYRFRPDGFDHRIVGADFLFRHENYIRKLGEQAR